MQQVLRGLEHALAEGEYDPCADSCLKAFVRLIADLAKQQEAA